MGRQNRERQTKANAPIWSERLNRLMTLHGVTQGDIARRISIAPSTVSGWCQGKKRNGVLEWPRPDAEDLIKLSRLFSVSVDYILGLSNRYAESSTLFQNAGFAIGLTATSVETLYEISHEDDADITNTRDHPRVIDTVNELLSDKTLIRNIHDYVIAEHVKSGAEPLLSDFEANTILLSIINEFWWMRWRRLRKDEKESLRKELKAEQKLAVIRQSNPLLQSIVDISTPSISVEDGEDNGEG